MPKKYGLRQTIGDTLGIGGIFRGLRTIVFLRDLAKDMEEVCPDAWFLNYTNPMAIIIGYMQRYTKIKTIGLCHSVQVCSGNLLKKLDMENVKIGSELIAGINHMGWLLEVKDSNGNGIHPTHIGKLPVQCAAMNMTNINPQLLTIEAAVTGKKEHIYQAAMLDPHTASELSIEDIISMCDDLIEAHEKAGYPVL